MNVFDYIKKAVAKSPKPIILEIGAARGEDTEKILEVIHDYQKPYEYFAFEPDPRNIEWFRSCRSFPLVNFVPRAVSDHNGTAVFHQSSGTNPQFGYEHTLSGSVKAPKDHLAAHPWCKFESRVEVKTMRLDDFAKLFNLPYIDFIWCDVQGAEDLVIAGGLEALAKTRFLYTEYYNNEMYEGQISLSEIHARLPGSTGTWSLAEVWPNDALFENTLVGRQ